MIGLVGITFRLGVWVLRPVVYALALAARLPFVERIYWNPAKFRQVANA